AWKRHARSMGITATSKLYLAIDAGTNRQRHCAALMAEPRRDDRSEPASRAAGAYDQQLIRGGKRGVLGIATLAHHRALAHLGPFAPAHACAGMDEAGDVSLAPSRRLQMLAQLTGNDQRVVA